MEKGDGREQMRSKGPGLHCITNPVAMQDVANILLAGGGSAIMGCDPEEVQELTALCQGTLLNLGVPDEKKFEACILAGVRANELLHPVILDPVGVGASCFRRRGLETLLEKVHPSIIRCNQEEACVLLSLRGISGREAAEAGSGGVESGILLDEEEQEIMAGMLARVYGCTAFISGSVDVISDGEHTTKLRGGDERITRITGSGCMLSALCGLFCGRGMDPYEAACRAGKIWKECSSIAGEKTDSHEGGIGMFHMYLFDGLDEICRREEGQ